MIIVAKGKINHEVCEEHHGVFGIHNTVAPPTGPRKLFYWPASQNGEVQSTLQLLVLILGKTQHRIVPAINRHLGAGYHGEPNRYPNTSSCQRNK